MNEIQQAAYIQAMAACAIVEAMGMLVHNQQLLRGESPYSKGDFDALIEKYGIHHNAVVGALTGR